MNRLSRGDGRHSTRLHNYNGEFWPRDSTDFPPFLPVQLKSKIIRGALMPPAVIVLFLCCYLCCGKTAKDSCQPTQSFESPCVKGMQNVTTTFSSANKAGVCETKQWIRKRHCDGGSGQCVCELFGDSYVMTYDEIMFRFRGPCGYILSRFNGPTDLSQCNFEIAMKQAPTGKSKDIIIFMHEMKIELRANRRLYVNGKFKEHPAKLDRDLEVYSSLVALNFASTRCKLSVAVDDEQRVTIRLPKDTYAGKLAGLCGDCNGKRDDFVTAAGENVSQKQERAKLFAESWKSAKLDCVVAPDEGFLIPPCDAKKQENYLKREEFCGPILDQKGVFASCAPKVNLQGIALACVNELCAAKTDMTTVHKLRCNIFQSLEELCVARGGGHDVKDWRAKFGCDVSCGPNRIYLLKMPTCVATCESHLLDEARKCRASLPVSGCACKPGFVLDGERCVDPSECQCLEECVDRAPPKSCQAWAAAGRCTTNPNLMASQCRLSCKLCKANKPVKCQDFASTERCQKIKEEGGCKSDFNQYICGATCKPDHCVCRKPEEKKTECNEQQFREVRKVTYHLKNGVCTPTEGPVKREPCGSCLEEETVTDSPCDVCKGILLRKRSHRKRNPQTHECEHAETTEEIKCDKCDKNEEARQMCEGNVRLLKILATQQADEKCRKCKQREVTTVTQVHCAPQVTRTACNSDCVRERITTPMTLTNCKCVPGPKETTPEVCCCKAKKNDKKCINGCMVEISYRSQLVDGQCDYSKIIRSTKCPKTPKDSVVSGTCTNGKRTDKITKYFIEDCQVKSKVYSHSVACIPTCSSKKQHTCIQNSLLVDWQIDRYWNGQKCEMAVRKMLAKKEITCEQADVMTKPVCDKQTCIVQREVSSCQVINCSAVRQTQIVFEKCCCPKPATTVKCLKDNTLLTEIRTFSLVEGKCESRVTKQIRSSVVCPTPVETTTDCQSNKRTVRTTTYRKILCKCHELVTESEEQCDKPCNSPSAWKSDCHQHTCIQLVQNTIYHRVDGACHQEIIRQLKRCCSPPPKKFTRCEPKTGDFEVRVTSWLPTQSKEYREITHFSIKPVVCGKDERTVDECGQFFKNLQLVHVKRWMKVRATCSCKAISDVYFQRCSCPATVKQSRTCLNGMGWQIERKTYQLLGGACLPIIEAAIEKVTCPPRKELGLVCRKCQQFRKVQLQKLHNCECVSQDILEPTQKHCCCPPDTTSTECLDNNRLITLVSKHSKNCEAKINKKEKKITCPAQKEETVGVCGKDCWQEVTHGKSYVKNCACVRLQPVKTKRRCCCPKEQSEKHCLRDKIVKITKSYSLHENACKLKQTTDMESLQCPPLHKSFGECSEETKQRLVTTTTHVFNTEKCQCEKNVSIVAEACDKTCPETVVEKKILADKVELVRTSYLPKHIDGKWSCDKKEEVVGVSPGECPKSVTFTSCDTLDHALVVKRTIEYKRILKTIEGKTLEVCEPHENLNYQYMSEVCANKAAVKTECKDFIQRHVTYEAKGDSCDCEPIEVKKACDCSKKDTVQHECSSGNKIIRRHSYVAQGEKCVPRTDIESQKVNCPATEKTVGPCNIHNGSTMLRLVQKTYYKLSDRSCKCESIKEMQQEVCGCAAPIAKRECLSDHWLRQSTRFELDLKRRICVAKETQTTSNIDCPQTTISEGPCDPATCRQEYKITKYIPVDCKCRAITKTEHLPCCCSAVNTKRQTQSTGGQVVETWHDNVLTNLSRPLVPGLEHSPFERRCLLQLHERRQMKTCEVREVTKVACQGGKFGVVTMIANKADCCKCRDQHKKLVFNGCLCKEPTVFEGPCKDDKYERVITFHAKTNGHCGPVQTVKSWLACSCPAAKVDHKCENGYLVRNVTHYQLRDGACLPIHKLTKTKVELPDGDSKVFELHRGDCDYKTGFRTVKRVQYKLPSHKCDFEAHYSDAKEKCICNSCEVISKTCEKDGQQYFIRQKCMELQMKSCVPVIYSKLEVVECNKERVITMGACDKESGKQVQTTKFYAIELCKCVEKVERKQIDCNCQGREENTRTCKDKKTLTMRKRTSRLDHGRCVDRVVTETVAIASLAQLDNIVQVKISSCDTKTCLQIMKLTHFGDEVCGQERPAKVTKKTFSCCKPKHEDVSGCKNSHELSTCTGITLKTSECSTPNAQGFQYVTKIVLQNTVANCKCIEKQIHLSKEACGCPKTVSSEKNKCDASMNRQSTKMISYRLLQGTKRCAVVTKLTESIIRCDKNNDQTELFGVCMPGVHQIQSLSYKSKVENCNCQREKKETVCDCRCEESRSVHLCDRSTGILRTTQFIGKWRNCKCERTKRTAITSPKCQEKPVVKMSKCEKDAETGKRVHVITSHQERLDKGSCTCKIMDQGQVKVPCMKPGANSSQETKRSCVGENNLILRLYKYRLSGSGLPQVTLSVSKKTIKCPESKTEIDCKKGIQKKTIYVLRGCVCKKHKTQLPLKCKCSPEKRVAKLDICDKTTCIQRVTLEWQTEGKNGVCETQSKVTKRLCCCPQKRRVSKICQTNGRVRISTLDYRLTPGKKECTKVENHKVVPVECSQDPVVERNCDKTSGLLTINHYRNEISSCKCVKKLMRAENARCACPKAKVEKQCDQKNSAVILIRTKYALKDEQCQEEEEKSVIPISCGQRSAIYEGPCDAATGYKEVTVTTSSVDGNCQCKLKKEKRRALCKCPDTPKAVVECLKDGIRRTITKSFELIGGSCVEKTSHKDVQVQCEPREWVLAPNQQACGPSLTFQRRVREGCTCKTQTKKMECPCKCEKPATTQCKADGITKVITEWKGTPINCKCQFVKSQNEKRAECSKPKTTIGACNTSTCLREIETVTYKMKACQCVAEVQKKSESCCCAPPTTYKTCQYHMMSRTVISGWSIATGHCQKTTTEILKAVVCPKVHENDCEDDGECKNGFKRIRCPVFKLHYCHCQKSYRYEQRPCGCPDPALVKGTCDKSTCVQKDTLTTYKKSGTKCKAEQKTIEQKCCCSDKTSVTSRCERSVKFLTTTSDKLEPEAGVCTNVQSTTQTEVECKEYKKWGACQANCHQTMVHRKYIVKDCECKQVYFRMEKRRCCCPQNGHKTQECQNDVFRLVTSVEAKMVGRQCHSRKKITKHRLTCNEPRIIPRPCDPKKCNRQIFRVVWTPKNCKCAAKLYTKYAKCCDLHQPSTESSCDPMKGILYHTDIDYTFNEANGEFEKKQKTREQIISQFLFRSITFSLKHAACSNESKRLSVSKCLQHPNGKFIAYVEVEFETRVGCSCEKFKRHEEEICGCPADKTVTQCSPTGVIETIHESYTLKAGQCTLTRKLLKTAKPSCPAKEIKQGPCELDGYRRYTLITHVPHGCDCKRQETVKNVLCSCPKGTQSIPCDSKAKSITHYSYQLKCDNQEIPECNCEKAASKLPAQMQSDNIEKSKCVEGTMTLTINYHVSSDCKCKRMKTTKVISCNDCLDFFDKSQCLKVKQEGGCLSPRTSANCRETCNICFRNEVNLDEKHVPGADLILPSDVKSSKKAWLKTSHLSSIAGCVLECRANKDCLSVGLNFRKKECRLYHPNTQIVRELGYAKPLFFDLDSYYVELTSKKVCPPTKYERVKEAPSKIGKQLCIERLRVTHFELRPAGNCQERSREIFILCGAIDEKPKEVCQNLFSEGKCGTQTDETACGFTCNHRKTCSGVIETEQCHRDGKEVSRTVTRIQLHAGEGICQAVVRKEELPSKCTHTSCPNPSIYVTECHDGLRHLIKVAYNYKRRCEPLVKRETRSCQGCRSTVRTQLGKCHNGQREHVQRFFTNTEFCCREEKVTTKWPCSADCQSDQVIHGVCAYGKKVVTTLFYTGQDCVRRTFNEEVTCLPWNTGLPLN